MPGARSGEPARASREGPDRVLNEGKKQETEEQDGAHGDALSLGPCGDTSTPGSRPSRAARSFTVT